jgi:ABC-type dipeptide/oligopeptide/nickel transport system permease subunit
MLDRVRNFLRGLQRSPAFRYLRRDIRAQIGGVIVLLVVFTAIFAGFIARHDPVEDHNELRFQGPSWNFPFGTDDRGRDIFSRVVYGARTALLIGTLLVVVQTSIGLPLGLLAGYRGGNVDNVIMRLVDAVLAMPGLIIALAFVAVFGPGIYKVILALAVTGWAGYARLIRGQTLAIKEEPYIESARAIGEKDRNIIFRYVLPNAISPLIVMVTMTFPAAILLSSSMSFLGLGVQPPSPDWGYDLNAYRIYMADPWPAPLMSILPGIVMVITIFGFNFFGDALRDAYDPRLRE